MNDALPRATWWAHAYNTINPICWGIVTGVPMQLLLKDLRASATIIGVLLAIPPAMQLLQLAIAGAIDRIGYKPFALLGWAWRMGMVLALAALALTKDWLLEQGVPSGALVAAVLVLLLAFNALRIISNAAFMPWYSVLIPDHQRGRFLARENAAGAIGGILTAGTAWAIFAWNPPGVYGLLFAIAALFGVMAMSFVERIPAVPAPPRPATGEPPALRAILSRPYVAQLSFNVLWALALSGSGVCWVGVLRDIGHAPAAMPALMPAVGAFAALALMPVVGPVVDRTGSRPALAVGCLITALHLVMWGLLTVGILPFGWPALILIQTFAAVGGALFALSSVRLLMGIIPVEHRARGFALQGVVTGAAGALFPILWGLLHDGLIHHGIDQAHTYAVIYTLGAVLCFATVLVARKLPDPGAHRMRDFVRILATDLRNLVRR